LAASFRIHPQSCYPQFIVLHLNIIICCTYCRIRCRVTASSV